MSLPSSVAGRGASPGGRPPRTPPLGASPGGTTPRTPPLGTFVVRGPAVFPGDPQPGEGRRPCGVPGGRLVIGIASEDHRGLPPGHQPASAPGRRDVRTRPEAVDKLACGLRRHVVEKLPVHHHDRGIVAGRVTLHPLQAYLAVRGWLVTHQAQMLTELSVDRVAT